ncbi:MAG: carbohydrate binding family 9 domain-containing protein [Vicinamibacterales bacterium]
MRFLRCLALAALALPVPALSSAQAALPPAQPPLQVPGAAPAHRGKSVTIVKVGKAPLVDGILDEAAWQLAAPAEGFMQRDPHEGAPSTETTSVRVVSDGKNLYFGVLCADSDPAGILSRELRRDAELANDDTFAIILDTFHDHRNGFLFRVNPQGAQFDALIADEGRHVNTTWDEEWQVETRLDAQGWTAEIRIPLRAIRFAASDAGAAFGMDFERVIRRKNELSYWNSYDRNYTFQQLSQAGHLTGISGLAADSRLRIKPYAKTENSYRGITDRRNRLGGDIGLEDLKYTVTPALALDLTINTDFAQAEVDEVVANFDRVPVFFPERRDFFLEGAGQFEFGSVRGEGDSEIKLYHSRRIGLSDAGRAIPIVAGAKIAGKVGDKYTLGLLSVQTADTEDQQASNYAVMRLRRNIFSRSSVGVFTTNRQANSDNYNRVAGVDTNLALLRHLTLTGIAARAFTSGTQGGQGFTAAGAGWTSDLLNAGLDFYRVDDNFKADLGFLERVGVTKYGPHVTVSPRPKSGPIRQWSTGVRLDHFRRNVDNSVETEVYHFNSDVGFQNGSGVRFTPHRRYEDLRRPFRLPRGVIVPPGEYDWWYFPTTYRFSPSHRVTGSVQYRIEPGYYGPGGRRQSWNLSPVVRLNSHVSARMEYSLNRIQLSGGTPINVHVMNSRLDVSFNRQWLTTTTFQYSNANDLVGVNLRLRYRYGPNHDLFVVLNSIGSDIEPLRRVDRSLTLKLTRSFEF